MISTARRFAAATAAVLLLASCGSSNSTEDRVADARTWSVEWTGWASSLLGVLDKGTPEECARAARTVQPGPSVDFHDDELAGHAKAAVAFMRVAFRECVDGDMAGFSSNLEKASAELRQTNDRAGELGFTS